MRHANYIVVEDDVLEEEPLVIRDVGPWSEHPTVTNDADNVVEELLKAGRLPGKRRLLYYDTEGHLDELLHDGHGFTGFKCLKQERQ